MIKQKVTEEEKKNKILVEQYTLLEQKVIEEKNKNKSLEEENTTLKQKITEIYPWAKDYYPEYMDDLCK